MYIYAYRDPAPDTNERTVLTLDEILLLDATSYKATIYATLYGQRWPVQYIYHVQENRIRWSGHVLPMLHGPQEQLNPFDQAQARYSIHKFICRRILYILQVRIRDGECCQLQYSHDSNTVMHTHFRLNVYTLYAEVVFGSLVQSSSVTQHNQNIFTIYFILYFYIVPQPAFPPPVVCAIVCGMCERNTYNKLVYTSIYIVMYRDE